MITTPISHLYTSSLINITVIIKEDMILRTCFKKSSMVAYKKIQNLRNLLVRARLSKGKKSRMYIRSKN